MENFRSLTNNELLSGLGSLVGSSRQLLARTLSYLGEIDDRRLYLTLGYSSLFSFCTVALSLSEDESYRRITSARLARRFPIITGHIASGALHMSALLLLREHLSEENHAELLQAASHKSKRAVEALLAARFPRPDIPSKIRKLPERAAQAQAAPGPAPGPWAAAPGETSRATEPCITKLHVTLAESNAAESNAAESNAGPTASGPLCLGVGSRPCARSAVAPASQRWAETHTPLGVSFSAPSAPWDRKRASLIAPLSSARYLVQLTANQQLKDKLERARDLMSHRNPKGDLAPVVEQALDLLLTRLEKTKMGKIQRPPMRRTPRESSTATSKAPAAARTTASSATPTTPTTPTTSESEAPMAVSLPASSMTKPVKPSMPVKSSMPRGASTPAKGTPEAPPAGCFTSTRSGTVTRAARRAVFERDGERCSFVGPGGRRCEATAFLEVDHIEPRALGGSGDIENLRVLCRAHNRLAAENVFGKMHVAGSIRQRQSNSAKETARHLFHPRHSEDSSRHRNRHPAPDTR